MYEILWGLKYERLVVTDIKRDKGHNEINPDTLQGSNSVKAANAGGRNDI